MTKEISSHGYSFEQEGDKIISVTYAGIKIKLDQAVVSNGRIFRKRGTKGIVKEIRFPFTDGYTNDILEVSFEKNMPTSAMKFKDLIL